MRCPGLPRGSPGARRARCAAPDARVIRRRPGRLPPAPAGLTCAAKGRHPRPNPGRRTIYDASFLRDSVVIGVDFGGPCRDRSFGRRGLRGSAICFDGWSASAGSFSSLSLCTRSRTGSRRYVSCSEPRASRRDVPQREPRAGQLRIESVGQRSSRRGRVGSNDSGVLRRLFEVTRRPSRPPAERAVRQQVRGRRGRWLPTRAGRPTPEQRHAVPPRRRERHELLGPPLA